MSNKPNSSNGKAVTHVQVQGNNDLIGLDTETASTFSEAPDELTFGETTQTYNDDLNSISSTPTTQRRARKRRETVGSEPPEEYRIDVDQPWVQKTKVRYRTCCT